MSEAQTQNTYDLPFGYDDNRIVLLARDPHWLFAYWEISEESKKNFVNDFGYDVWERSVPVLKIINVSNNSSFYVRINDFSNSWYINVPDPNSLYVAEIGRRLSEHFFINLANSNYVYTPSETASINTAAYFMNYKDLRNGRIDLDTLKVYETYNFKIHTESQVGISSPELFRNILEESHVGVSSAELFGANISEYFGISSESFIK